MFRTITAKYHGICRRCNGPIAIGDRIRYGGAGRSYHFASACGTPVVPGYTSAGATMLQDVTADAIAAGAPVITEIAPRVNVIRRTRRTARRSSGGYIGRDYYDRDTDDRAGREFMQNPRGRCEDAPCCGCCS